MNRQYKQPCDHCNSSDAVTIFEDGHSWCFSCEHYEPAKDEELEESVLDLLIKDDKDLDRGHKRLTPIPSSGSAFIDMSDRGISHKAAERYKVFRHPDPFFSWVYPRFKDGVHVANKVRVAGKKSFSVEGLLSDSELFGQGCFPPGSARTITICEGQDDALAAFEMQGFKYPCVSIDSTSSAVHDVAKAYEYLNAFDEIVLCFDKDEAKIQPDGTARYPGQEAAVQVASMFELGKVRILTLQRAKDANDYLRQGLSKEFMDEWWKAPKFVPNGLKLAKNMWDLVSSKKNKESVPYPWEGLNEFTYGIRKSEFVLITAETGVGKTQVIKSIENAILQKFLTKEISGKLGLLHLEESNEDTLLGLMSIDAGKPLHLPDVRESVDEQELRKYFDQTCNNDGLVLWDHFGSNEITEVVNKIRHMAALGCDYVFFDHLSIVVSDQNGDERKQLDEICTKLKMLQMELDIAIIGVIHQNRAGQVRGSAGPEQLANIILKLFRDKEDPDPWRRNVTKIMVQKNRFSGRTGPCTYLEYIPETGLLVELTGDQIKQYEAGGTSNIVDTW